MTAIYLIIALILAMSVFLSRKKVVAFPAIIIFILNQIVFNVQVILHKGDTNLWYFRFDELGLIFLSVLTLIASVSVYHAFKYFRHRVTRHFFTYFAAFIGLVTFISLAYLANDATVVWILVEATTLTASVLIYHEKTNNSLEAAWKYLFLCSVGIAFAYIGILFIGLSANTGEFSSLNFENIALLAQKANPLYLKIAFVFVLIGYSTKMELFPMHTVGIDANSVAPSPAAAILSTGLVNLGFIAIFRIYNAFSHSGIFEWMNHILILSGMLSILVAAGYMMKAKHNKRMLAYSTLENMGLVAIALGIGGKGYYAAILLLILHAFAKSALFFQMGQVSRVLNTWWLDESGDYFRRNPAGSFVLLLGMFALLAIPPSGAFFSEFLIIGRLVETNQWVILVITLLLLCFIVYAFATRVLHILFSQSRNVSETTLHSKVGSRETWSQFLFLGLVFTASVYQPQWLQDAISQIIHYLPQ